MRLALQVRNSQCQERSYLAGSRNCPVRWYHQTMNHTTPNGKPKTPQIKNLNNCRIWTQAVKSVRPFVSRITNLRLPTYNISLQIGFKFKDIFAIVQESNYSTYNS